MNNFFNNNEIEKKLKKIPEKSGSYIFSNKNDEIIYVGKAINLRKRVSSYFKKPKNIKGMQLINEIWDLKYFITSNEKEALLLEFNLIKKNRPKYNILLNDDKKYPYILITKEKDPQIKLIRNRAKKNDFIYQFGPFPDGTKANEILKIIKRLYPLRACKGSLKKPCLHYQINQCLGSCFKEIDKKIYEKNINKIKLFLSGKTELVKKELYKKMKNFADSFQFEEAQKIKEIIEKINFFSSKQFIDISRINDVDYISYYSNNEYLIISIFFYRNGKLLSKDYKIFEQFENDINDVIRIYLQQLYIKNELPNIIIFNKDIDISKLENIFNCKIINSKTLEDKKIFKEIISDSKNFLINSINNENNIKGKELFLLKELQELVGLKEIPFLFEVYDISNIKKENQVAGVIVYKNGLPFFEKYRHYNLSNNNNSDYERMKELSYLRFQKRQLNKKEIPNLIIVDGGIIQINAILSNLPNTLKNIEIIGLVKNNKHQTNHIVDKNNKKYNIINKTLLNYLTIIQDKVHKFAISFHNKKRRKSMISK